MLCAVACLTSCENDGDKVYLGGFCGSELIVTADAVTLSVDNREDVVLSLAWKNPVLMSSDATQPVPDGLLSTSLQVAADESFSTVSETTVTSLSKAYTGTELNTLAKNIGLAVDVAAPLYFRIKSATGKNMTPAYSNVCKVTVTPFNIEMKRMAVLDKEKANTIATLFSPNEDGVYTGWMQAQAWSNCWFRENDGTVWGNVPVDGHAFELSNEGEAWNIWFGDGNGHWFVTVDTKNAEWSGINVTDLKLNGESMDYNSNTGTYNLVIKTTADNAHAVVTASGLEFNKTTGDGKSGAVPRELKFKMVDGIMTIADVSSGFVIPKAGTYTVSISINENAEYAYTVTEGEVKPDVPGVKYPAELKVYSKDGSEVLATLAKTADGIYEGTMTATKWMNFKIVDEENGVWYGSDASDRYTLSSAGGAWDIWVDDDFADGDLITVTANLNTMKWSYRK